MAETFKKELDEVEIFISDIEESLNKIKSEMERSDLEAQVFLIKLKHQKLRAMAAVEKSRSVLANMELMLAKTEIGLAVSNLGSISNERPKDLKKKSSVKHDEPSPKKMRLNSEREPVKQSSKKTCKENRKKHTSSKRSSKNQQNAVEPPQITCDKKVNEISADSGRSPITIPMNNLTNLTRPVGCKKTIYLENPPVRDTKVKKNIGYYTSAYANEVLGHKPNTLPETLSRTDHKSLMHSNNIAQDCHTRLNRAFNLSVTPGYNLNVMPGYLVQHQAQVHQTENFDNNQKGYTNDQITPRIDNNQEVKGKELNQLDGPGADNYESTNKLFQEIMCNKRNESQDDEKQSLASAETLVITMNLEDFQNLTPDF